MILFVNVMFEYESFDDWSWLRTGGGCGEPEITGSSRCLYYFSVFMCKTGIFQPKESREGLDIALTHTEMTRLSQPCDKVVTTMSTIDKVVTTLWIGCHYLVTRL